MTICGWCDEEMVPATTASAMGAEATSHGLCRPCLDQALARVRTQPVASAPQFPVSAPALAPLFARA